MLISIFYNTRNVYKKVRAEDGRITLKIDENESRIVKLILKK